MKSFIINIFNKIKTSIIPVQNLLLISLAAWGMHIILRILLLFRSNPYGFPFVSKPDWFIFHAVCIDFIWISKAFLIFLIVGALVSRLKKGPAVVTILYGIFHGVLLPFTLLDNEVQRFLGGHLSFGLVDTYKDTSSIIMFYDYVANDNSVPYLQFVVLALMLPLTYGIYRLLKRIYCKSSFGFVKNSAPMVPFYKKTFIFMIVFYIASSLFVNVIWTGNARMTKLRPVVSLIYNDLFLAKKAEGLDETNLPAYSKSYQDLWLQVEGDSLWEFESNAVDGKSAQPLYRKPTQALLESEKLQAQRAMKPNFILVLMESQRGLNVGYMNPQIKPTPTPFMDSMAAYSHVWMRMHTGGVPTTGGVLSSHLGIPHHSRLAQATDLAHVNLPSFVSTLTDAGYSTHYMSAADPAWDNLGVWMSKWYTAQHYNREREDDSTFMDHAISYVRDTLAKNDKPFFATLMTRSNHYPFNFAAGMTEEQKKLPLLDRINITMNYADRQLSRFIRAVENEEWYKNTYVIIMADHGFPLGENGVSTMNGGGFSNVSWVPFMIHGKGVEPAWDTTTAGQIDVAPTILELAGFAVPNLFMGHNLLRETGKGMAVGTYSKFAAVGLDGYRYIAKFPDNEESWLFNDGDMHQDKNLIENAAGTANRLKETLDTLIKISDYSLEHGL